MQRILIDLELVFGINGKVYAKYKATYEGHNGTHGINNNWVRLQ